MGADFAAADPCHHALDLREVVEQGLLEPGDRVAGLRQADGRRHRQADEQVALVHARCELRTQARKDQRARRQHDAGEQDRRPAPRHEETDGRTEPAGIETATLRPGRFRPQAQKGRRGCQQHGKHQRTRHGEDHGEGKRAEGLSLHPFEREDRQENHHDDEDGENQRLQHLGAGLRHDSAPVCTRFGLAQTPVGVLHHDHRPVDHHADGDGDPAQRHQIGRNVEQTHRDQREPDREGDGRHHDQTRPPAAQEGEQDNRNQQGALPERRRHGRDRGTDQFGLVVIGYRLDALGQGLVDAVQPVVDAADHFIGIRPDQLEHQPGNDLALAVHRGEALAGCAADFDPGDIPNAHRHAIDDLDDDIAQIVLALGQADGPHCILLGVLDQELRPGIGVIGLYGRHHVRDGEVVAQERLRPHIDLVLPFETAQRENLGHAAHGLQVELHQPVLDGAQFDAVHGAVGAVEEVEEDLSEPGGDRPHGRLAEAVGYVLTCQPETFADELAGPVDIRPVLEIDIHDRQAEIRGGADFRQPGQTIHRRLDREGDIALHLFGGEAFGLGEDLHQGGRDVGESVNRHGPEGDSARQNDRDEAEHRQEAPAGDAMQEPRGRPLVLRGGVVSGRVHLRTPLFAVRT